MVTGRSTIGASGSRSPQTHHYSGTHFCLTSKLPPFLTQVSSTDHKLHLKAIRAYLLELERHIAENSSLMAPYLPHINGHLHNAVLACRAAQPNTGSPAFANKQYIPSGKKLEHQWKFTITCNTPGRKRKGITLQ